MGEPNDISIEEDRIMEEDEVVDDAVILLEKAVNAIVNAVGKETELTGEIRHFLLQLGVDVWTDKMIAELNDSEYQYVAYLDIDARVPYYEPGCPKLTRRKIQAIMRQYECDNDVIEGINDDFCQGFGVSRNIVVKILKERYEKTE